MLTLYETSKKGLRPCEYSPPGEFPKNVVWIDMVQPSPEEEQAVEHALHVNVPTREELQEIEVSSRLYKERDALFMTATVISHADTPRPETTTVTFVLIGERLISVRYVALEPFNLFLSPQGREGYPSSDGQIVLMGLLDAIVDRVADVLEQAGRDFDAVSYEIFSRNEIKTGEGASSTLQGFLQRIGRSGDVNSKVSESLVSLARLLAFLGAQGTLKRPEVNSLLEILDRDVKSLTSQASFLSDKANFLLAANLGMINIEQTDIVKIFSVAAVIFLPPTLVASIYGMNFQFMPELHWLLGYPFAIVLMILSALVPYRYFKRRGWL